MPENLRKSAIFWQFQENEKEIYTTTWSYFENWDPYRNYLIARINVV